MARTCQNVDALVVRSCHRFFQGQQQLAHMHKEILMKISLLTLSVTLAAVSTSCGIIKVQGLGGGGSSTATPSRPASAATSVASANPIKGAPADDGAYQKISYERFVKTLDLDGDYAFRVVDGSATHPENGGNPDPTWIKHWDAPMTQEDAKTIIAQAAINRTWLARAEKDFAAWFPKISALAASQAQAIAKIESSVGNHYERTIALRALWNETNKAATAVELGDNALLQFQVAQSVAKSNENAGVGFATQRFLIAINADSEFANVARPFYSKDEEWQLFLVAAADGSLARTIGTPKLPVTAQNTKTQIAVKWPLSAARDKQLRGVLQKIRSIVQTWFVTEIKSELFDDTQTLGPVWVDGEGQGDDVANGFTSKKVTAISNGKLILTGYKRNKIPTNCKTGVVTNLDGTKEIGQNCSYKSDDTKIVITLNAKELPIKIQIGDQLSFTGQRKNQQEKNKAISAEIDATYISKVTRKGKVLFTE
jgi:hypothetical protein